MPFEFIKNRLTEQHDKDRYRRRYHVAQQSSRELHINGKCYLNFSSNDYLGLNNHPKINKAMQEGIDKYGLCASASSLITGYQYPHQALEDEICTWLNKSRCLLYSSGFAANLGVLQTLGQDENTAFFLDKLSHASLIDGALSANAKVKRFLHNDTAQLERYLEQASTENKLIVSEGVFSMDGDKANISELCQLANEYNAWSYIDDAHSIGVIGKQGEGSISEGNIDIIMATFGKAIATSGAFVACDENLFEYLVNFSRHYIYSTAISPALAWATKASIEIIQKEHWRREKITELSHLLSSTLDAQVKLITTQSSIHAIEIGSEIKTLEICEKLKEMGIWLTAIRPPTVAKNSSRLRVTICSNHNTSDISHLSNSINKVLS
ncbi:MAG: 8-amino-7-oxononanoate synthase [Alteromonadaceae bacterium]|jgi:8-amino-7-oxononanoate synthase